MPENLMDSQGATVLTAIVVVAIALLALVGVFWLIRNRAASTFIRGGKNRMPRLAVLDATAVDTRRRLVLIRRDDVEHLVMIGGPTDIVIESGIPLSGQSRKPHQPDQPMPSPPHQPRTAHTALASRPAAPHSQPSPPEPSVATPTPRAPVRSEAVSRPSPRPQTPQTPQASPSPVVAAAATAATRSDAADLLESARNRVFEEPEFKASDLEDLIAVAQPTPQSAPTPAPALNPSQPVGTGTDPLQTQAADVLETVRTRIFEEPTFDEDAFDELTGDAPSRAPPAPDLRATDAPAAATAPVPTSVHAPGPTHATPPSLAPTPTAESTEFEAVLEAELAEDPTLGSPRESLITAQYHEHQLAGDDDELHEAPEVKPEPQQSRDSLEQEMEKLLGDLSRK